MSARKCQMLNTFLFEAAFAFGKMLYKGTLSNTSSTQPLFLESFSLIWPPLLHYELLNHKEVESLQIVLVGLGK